MSTRSPGTLDATASLSIGRRRWIDFLLAGSGLWLLVAGWPQIGVPLLVFGTVMPLVQWAARRRAGVGKLVRFVPPELATSYRDVLDAARLPGVVDQEEVVRAAGEALLEVAAVLAGRPPRGAAQRRFVAARVQGMTEAGDALRERHHAWMTARAEVRAISIVLPEPQSAVPSDRLAGVLAVALFPFFLIWDIARATAHTAVALVDGVALRIRTVGRLGVRAGAVAIALLGRSWKAWRRMQQRLRAALEEARHRVDAARLRMRLRLRRVRYRVRRLRLGA